MGVGSVIHQLEIVETEIEQGPDTRIQMHPGQREWLPGELQMRLVQVIEIEVGVPEGVNEIAGPEAGYLRHHQGQQAVTGDIEWHAEKDIRTALV